jgi:beta-glucanase (GH16 family)
MTSTEAETMVPRATRHPMPRRSKIRRARRQRRVLVLVVALVAVVIAVSVFVTRKDAVAEGPAKGPLLFNETFSGRHLDPNRWSPCYHWATDGCTNLSNHELEWYVPGQVKVAGGTLSLEARKQSVTGIDDKRFDYVSGLISGLSPDRELFSFKYGYVESRVKLPEGRGLWSAFWMLPATRESEPELDIFETVGEKPDVVAMHTHWSEGGKDRQHGFRWHDPDLTTGWHTFGLEWKPGSLTWYVDHVARWRVTDPAQIPHESMYLVANLAVGGRYTEPPDASTPFPSALKIDSIKVWGSR